MYVRMYVCIIYIYILYIYIYIIYIYIYTYIHIFIGVKQPKGWIKHKDRDNIQRLKQRLLKSYIYIYIYILLFMAFIAYRSLLSFRVPMEKLRQLKAS
jgi:hypothetical protein